MQKACEIKKSLYYASFELPVRETIIAIVSVLLKMNISGKEDEICAVRNAAMYNLYYSSR